LRPATRSDRHRHHQAGFTLIEALISIAVIAVSLAAIGSLTGTTTRGVRSIEQHVVLMETARTIAANMPSRIQPAPRELAGELFGSRWRIDVLPFTGTGVAPVPDSPWVPQTMAIRIQSPSGAVLDLQTVRLQRRRE
jgi:general secretion pathway protein I